MELTKKEAILLNVWKELKEILDIQEETELPLDSSYSISSSELLTLSKMVQERDNLPK